MQINYLTIHSLIKNMPPLNIENYSLLALTERVKELEDKVFKNKKKEATRAQKMLLLLHLGILDKIDDLNLLKKHKSKLIATLISSSDANIEGDLSNIKRSDSELKTVQNYQFLAKLFKELKLKSQEEEAEAVIQKLLRKK
jgi:hypothetical protein